jgi:hypothetical protein
VGEKLKDAAATTAPVVKLREKPSCDGTFVVACLIAVWIGAGKQAWQPAEEHVQPRRQQNALVSLPARERSKSQ